MRVVVTRVYWSGRVAKSIKKLPLHIRGNFFTWVNDVELSGIRDTRKASGLHDEPLKGERLGQRSVRLNKAYRAIYIERHDGTIECIEVIEVNKHGY